MKYLKLLEAINQNNDRFFTKDDFYCIMDRFQDLIDEWNIELDDRLLGQPRINVLRYYFNFTTMGNILNPIKGNKLTVDDCLQIYLTICYPRSYFFKLSNDLKKYDQFNKEFDEFIKVIGGINSNWEITKRNSFATDTSMIIVKFKKIPYGRISKEKKHEIRKLKRFNESDESDIDPNLRVSDDDLYEIEYIFRSEVIDNIDNIRFFRQSIEELQSGASIPNGFIGYTIYRYENARPDKTLVGNRHNRIGIMLSFSPRSIQERQQANDYNTYIQIFVDICKSHGWKVNGDFLLVPTTQLIPIYIMNRRQFNLSKV